MIDKQEVVEQISKLSAATKEQLNKYKFWPETGLTILALFLWGFVMYGVFFSAPAQFPAGTVVRVSKNTTISQIGQVLYSKQMIRSELIFKILARLSDSGQVVAGDYRFKNRTNVFTLARRLARGEFGIDPTRITIPEGSNSREIAKLLAKNLPAFDTKVFLELASKEEGRLYPDTYFIKPSDDEVDIVNMLLANFEKQARTIKLDLLASNKSLNEILTMASIIDVEARTAESRRMVSGILWNRVRAGMKLQVDAVFPYIMDKYSLQLTVSDLQVDSPYNTYKYKGLPPGPIGNPGLDSILAAINPTKTAYLYYLSDRSGKMYYAKTYEGHMANRRKYLGS